MEKKKRDRIAEMLQTKRQRNFFYTIISARYSVSYGNHFSRCAGGEIELPAGGDAVNYHVRIVNGVFYNRSLSE
jgi:hypothetical protein